MILIGFFISILIILALSSFAFEEKWQVFIKGTQFKQFSIPFIIISTAIIGFQPEYSSYILWVGMLMILAAVDLKKKSVRVIDLCLLTLALVPITVSQHINTPMSQFFTIFISQISITFFIGCGLIALKILLHAIYKQNALGGADIWVILTILFGMGGIHAIIAIYSAIFYSALIGLIAVIVLKKSRKTQIPFIPFLLMGVLTSMFFSETIVMLYQSMI